MNDLDTGLLSPVRAGTPIEELVGDAAWLQAMLDAESALARAQAALGTLPREAADTITSVSRNHALDLRAIAVSARENANPVVALVREFTRAVAEVDPAAGEYVHRGSTSQDVFDTAAMLIARRALRHIAADLHAAAASLTSLAREHRGTLIAGRTLALQAVPTTFGLKAAGWRQLVLTSAERCFQLSEQLPVSLGGAAGTLAGYAAYATPVTAVLPGVSQAVPSADDDTGGYTDRLVRAYAHETGLAVQTLPWHALRTPVADLGAVLGLTAGSLGKIAVDVITLSRTEIAEVAEPGPPGRGASSAMPHKRNPVLATLIRSAALQVPLLAAGLTAALAADDERSGGGWHAEWLPLRECLRLTGGATHTLVELAAGLEIKPERMEANLRPMASAMSTERIAAAFSSSLGRAGARELLTRCAQEAAGSGRTVREVLPAALAALPDGGPELTSAELDELCDPGRYTGSAAWLVDRAVGEG
ncbi:lyase family protein [Streptomyces sp. NPDC059256]|uniref:lyase family protein n=1 Tax=Streptomyces sp. NPDC059256 TaxID=3346794 RepID=UPI0036B204E2